MTTATRSERPAALRTEPDRQAPAPILEDDPSDPANGDPSTWPAWTDGVAYKPAKLLRRRPLPC